MKRRNQGFEIQVVCVELPRDEYEKLIAEWAECVYGYFSQLPENQIKAPESFTLLKTAEKFEDAHAA